MNNYVDKNGVIKVNVRDLAGDICEIFERLLDTYNISIPDRDREGTEEESRLFGENYSKIEDTITEALTGMITTLTDELNDRRDGYDCSISFDIVDTYNGSMGSMDFPKFIPLSHIGNDYHNNANLSIMDSLEKAKYRANELRDIANKLDALRLEIYPEIDDKDEDKQYINDTLFSLQSRIKDVSGLVRYTDFKDIDTNKDNDIELE